MNPPPPVTHTRGGDDDVVIAGCAGVFCWDGGMAERKRKPLRLQRTWSRE
jgi:hypothetical protein